MKFIGVTNEVYKANFQYIRFGKKHNFGINSAFFASNSDSNTAGASIHAQTIFSAENRFAECSFAPGIGLSYGRYEFSFLDSEHISILSPTILAEGTVDFKPSFVGLGIHLRMGMQIKSLWGEAGVHLTFGKRNARK